MALRKLIRGEDSVMGERGGKQAPEVKISPGGMKQPTVIKKAPVKKKEEEGEKGEKEQEKKEEEPKKPTGTVVKKKTPAPDVKKPTTVITKKEDTPVTPGYDPSLPVSYSQTYVPTESGGTSAPTIGGISITTIILLVVGVGVLFFLMRGKA